MPEALMTAEHSKPTSTKLYLVPGTGVCPPMGQWPGGTHHSDAAGGRYSSDDIRICGIGICRLCPTTVDCDWGALTVLPGLTQTAPRG